MFDAIDHRLNQLSSTFIFICSVALVILLFIFGWLVFGRYVLNVTPTWVEQMALLLVCYITFLGSAAAVYTDTHLGVTFIRESAPQPIRRFLRIMTDIAMSLFGLVMLIACIELLQFGKDTKLPMLNIPESFRTLPAAVCGGSMFLFAGMRAIARVREYYFNPSKTNSRGD